MAHDVLIVDDEDDIRILIAGVLKDEGYATREAQNDQEALGEIAARRPSLVILDIWLEGSAKDGMAILEVLRDDHPEVPVVMISGHGTVENAVQAIKMGAYDFIEKPFKADRLVLLVQRAIEAARLRREYRELRLLAGPDSELIGASASISQLRQAVEKVAPTGSRVLITGPAGSGKEVVARQLHRCSSRAQRPFVVVNCATMAPERMEIELFGIEDDDDANANARKVGLFEQAHGGTLLLDEVADMPFVTQGKIVRVLQEQTFERVGGNDRVQVDVRVVGSTNKDLSSVMSAGRFREDLYYRLNVVPLRVPPLEERREDIPGLVNFFMERSAGMAGVPVRRMGADAMAALQAYRWPGNVRQLKNVVDWILIMISGEANDLITADCLPPEINTRGPGVMRWENGVEMIGMPLREAREEFERQYLVTQIARFGGNISRTAEFIGMERSALHRKLRSLRVQSTSAPVQLHHQSEAKA